jgi:hypothetical protein
LSQIGVSTSKTTKIKDDEILRKKAISYGLLSTLLAIGFFCMELFFTQFNFFLSAAAAAAAAAEHQTLHTLHTRSYLILNHRSVLL